MNPDPVPLDRGYFEAGGRIFRVSSKNPLTSAEVLELGTLERVFLTGEDLRGLLHARKPSPAEADGLEG